MPTIRESTVHARTRRRILVPLLFGAVLTLLGAGCEKLPAGLAGQQTCVLGCAAPGAPKISPEKVWLSGPAYLNVRGTTTGDVKARTTTFQLLADGKWVDLETKVGEGTGDAKTRDLWAHIFIDHDLRPGIAATGYRPRIRIVEADGTSTVERIVIADHASLEIAGGGTVSFQTPLGASTTRDVQLRNTSPTLDLSVHHLQVEANGTGAFDASASGCSVVQPHETCTLQVTFRPTKTGRVSGTLTINSSAPVDSKLTLDGTAGAVGLSPSNLTLAELQSGVVTVTNHSSTTVTTTAASISGSSAGAAFVTAPGAVPARDCWGGAALAPGASCDVTVTFSGASAGAPPPWATLTVPVAGGDPVSVTIRGILPSTAATKRARRPAPVRVHFAGRLGTTTRITGAPGQTGGGPLTIDIAGAARTTMTAPSGSKTPAALARLLGSRFDGRGHLSALGARTVIDTVVLTSPHRSGRICARLRISGTRRAASGTLTLLGGTGDAARLHGTARFQLFRGDRATGIATVRTGASRPPAGRCLQGR